MASRIAGITIEIGGDTTKLSSAVSGVNKQLSATQSALKDVGKLLKLDPGNMELLQQKQKLLKDAISETKDKLSTLQEVAKSADLGAAEHDAVQREIIETQQHLQKLEDQYKEFGSVAAQQIEAAGKKMQDVGEKITGVGTKLSKAVTAPIVGIGTVAVTMASDFEDAMAKVSTIADDAEMPLGDLEKAIMDLSDQTGISASAIADNVYNAISAGQKTGDAVNFVSKAATLAKAGFADSASALDILTTIMNAYGLEADEVTRVSDVLINTQNLGKTTVGELASAMGKVIPTAKAQGVSLENLASMYAVMTSNGIATAETTTYLNAMLNELGKQGTTAADAFAAGTGHIKEGGLTMAEAMEQGWSLTDVLSVLSDQAAKSGTSISNIFSSSEAGKAANVLLDNASKLNDVVDQMGNAAGATAEAFDKLDDTASYKLQKSLNQLKNTGIEVGSTLLEILQPALDTIADVVRDLKEWWDGLSESQQQFIVKAALVAAAIGPVVTGVGKMTSGIGGLTTGIGKIIERSPQIISILGELPAKLGTIGSGILNLASGISTTLAGAISSAVAAAGTFAASLAPILPIILAVVAVIGVLTVAGVALYKHWDEIKEWAAEKWTAIKDTISGAVEGVKSAMSTTMQAAHDTVREKLNNIKSAYEENGGGIKGILAAGWESIKGYYTAGFTFLDKLTGGKLSGLAESFRKKMDSIREFGKGAIEKIKGLFDFEWHLPDIKLPHFSITGSFSLDPPSIPSIDVKWYSKAMHNAMILDRPTIFGTAGDKFLGAGDAGKEVVSGESHLMSLIDAAVGNSIGKRMEGIYSLLERYLPGCADTKVAVPVNTIDRALSKSTSRRSDVW